MFKQWKILRFDTKPVITCFVTVKVAFKLRMDDLDLHARNSSDEDMVENVKTRATRKKVFKFK